MSKQKKTNNFLKALSMTITEFFLELRKKIPYTIEEETRDNVPVLRIGFSRENTRYHGITCYNEIIKHIPDDFNFIIQPNFMREGEEIIIYKSKQENMQTVSLSTDGNSVSIDGVIYDKRKDGITLKPISGLHISMPEIPESITVCGVEYELIEKKKNDPELKTFNDCWNKVKPEYFINDFNEIRNIKIRSNCTFDKQFSGHLPTYKMAKQIQAAIKLFVVRHALQGEWEPESGRNDTPCYVWFNGTRGLLIQKLHGQAINTPFAYRSEDLAIKSMEIAADIYKEWFGVNE